MLSKPVKHLRYEQLVTERKACQFCSQYALTNPSCIDVPADSERIGPYSLWQGNLDSPLVVVGQDFADVDGYQINMGWPGENVGTNLTLVKLVAEAGLNISAPKKGASEDVIFCTNAVLCLKQGGMQAAVRSVCYSACGKRFLRPLIELIKPKAVATLGSGALKAILRAYEIENSSSLLNLLDSGRTFDLSGGVRLFPMAHPSKSVLNITRSLETQLSDWRKLGAYLESSKGSF